MNDYVPTPQGVTTPLRTPLPIPCPICGLTADNVVVTRTELTASATFICTEAHLFALVWVEVA